MALIEKEHPVMRTASIIARNGARPFPFRARPRPQRSGASFLQAASANIPALVHKPPRLASTLH